MQRVIGMDIHPHPIRLTKPFVCSNVASLMA
jgi:hypothetical protein